MCASRCALLLAIGRLWPVTALAQDLVTVPSVVGLTESQARTRLQESGVVRSFTVEAVEWQRCERRDVTPGIVCTQTPAAHARRRLTELGFVGQVTSNGRPTRSDANPAAARRWGALALCSGARLGLFMAP